MEEQILSRYMDTSEDELWNQPRKKMCWLTGTMRHIPSTNTG